ncbi:hypothetical protein BDZ89DRAFT_977733 [Hymenopellis radicata]|nr:hypothetical protein BDZ89DRAFT_977733 [Hymenopellis radicata]
MGASQSKADDKVFVTDTAIQFSPEVVDQLAANLTSPEVSPERQSTLDVHVRSRIQTELKRLRKEEEDVRQRIEQALEKENLDREQSMTGEGSEMGAVKDSVSLMNDLEEIKGKVDRFHGRKDLQELPDVKTYQEAVLSCYRSKSARPLECWKEVTQFKAAVEQLEKQYVKSLQ